MDDFGAGFSSFTYLKDLVADYLKIDGSFVRGAGGDHINWIFVEMINDIAHRLNIRSIAEFVEDQSMAVALREIGVDLAQGDFFGKPSSSCSFPGLRGPKTFPASPAGQGATLA